MTTTPAEAIASAIQDVCDLDGAYPYRPLNVQPRTVYIDPADPWKQRDDDVYCRLSVGLDAYLVAGTTDQKAAFAWLDTQTDCVMGMAPFQVGDDADDDWVSPTNVGRPFLLVQDAATTHTYVAVKIEFSRFNTGDE